MVLDTEFSPTFAGLYLTVGDESPMNFSWLLENCGAPTDATELHFAMFWAANAGLFPHLTLKLTASFEIHWDSYSSN